ncbi:hypothetical protein PR048_021561 [Dryococelus australis]|uniref:Uncharacterized protein n=1 Tax=Dryococelus australis TaxID=614101 RepID=A0ABQ9GYL7_9NEOP|nr:hypothetical protein PR048_021561 [Dryococelus australis]
MRERRCMEQRRNEIAGETGDPREIPPTSGIVRHDSHLRKSGSTRPGIEPGSPWWEASRLTAQPPWPRISDFLSMLQNKVTEKEVGDIPSEQTAGRTRQATSGLKLPITK